MFCPGAKGFAFGLLAAFFSWPGALGLAFPPPVDGVGLVVGDGVSGPDVDPPVDEGTALAVLVPAAFRLLLDPLAPLMPLAVLLKTSVVAVPSAFMPATTLATSSSKSTAYSGPATPASSFAMRRNILAPEAARDMYRPRLCPRPEKAMFGYIVSRLIRRFVELLTVTEKPARGGGFR